MLLLLFLPLQSVFATQSHEVKKGDTLWGIAQKYDVPLHALKSVNEDILESDIIYPGDFLTTPARDIESDGGDDSSDIEDGYKVETGDTLWGIATSNDLTVNELMRANNLRTTVTFPGQVLDIKKKEFEDGTDTKYVVLSGDNLWRIALKKNTSVSQLMALNNLDSHLIHPGQVLVY